MKHIENIRNVDKIIRTKLKKHLMKNLELTGENVKIQTIDTILKKNILSRKVKTKACAESDIWQIIQVSAVLMSFRRRLR